MPNFSIILIARNEELTLPRLVGSLEHYQKRGGEIIVVDTGSTDNTAQVARGLGCKVEEVGERFLTIIDEEKAKEINDRFIIGDEAPLVKIGDKLFDFASARNYAASLASNDWVWQPDCDEIFTAFNIDEIEKAISETGVDSLTYNFVFSHDEYGNEAIKFMHSKMYKRSLFQWFGIVHETLGIVHEV